MQIRNWAKFQHFKDRRPPWVKLYRDLLDDRNWHSLSGDDAKTLTMLWLLASEDEEQNGTLPDVETIAFRLRTTELKVKQSLTRLSHWLVQDDINLISERYQVGPPETETETETYSLETETEVCVFETHFWPHYPFKKNKAQAEKAFNRLAVDKRQEAIFGLTTFQFSQDAQLHASTYLNNSRWEDERTEKTNGAHQQNGSGNSSQRKLSAAERVERAIAERDAKPRPDGRTVDADGWIVR